MTLVVNTSLQSGVFSKKYKLGLVTPLLKQPKIIRELLSNYRPVINLSFVPKIIERAVAAKLDEHLSSLEISKRAPSQSPYRSGFSTETAFRALQNDLLLAAGQGGGSLVLRLDLSAGFDTVDHRLLLGRLSFYCGIAGNVSSWFTSYIEGRKQSGTKSGEISAAIEQAH